MADISWMPERFSKRIYFVLKQWTAWTHVVHDQGMGVHDPCTMNYMEVYGDHGNLDLQRDLIDSNKINMVPYGEKQLRK